MRKVLVGMAALAMSAGSLAVVACVGSDPGPVTSAATPDASSTTEPSTSTTTPAPTTTTTTSNDDAGKTTDSGSDSGSGRTCTFQTTQYPCNGGGEACYSDAVFCPITACSGADALQWACNSPNQCSNGPCCIPAGVATYLPGANCVAGTLLISASAMNGAYCSTTPTCADDSGALLVMCQLDSQCPPAQHCAPALVGGGAPGSMKGETLGLCTPN